MKKNITSYSSINEYRYNSEPYVRDFCAEDGCIASVGSKFHDGPVMYIISGIDMIIDVGFLEHNIPSGHWRLITGAFKRPASALFTERRDDALYSIMVQSTIRVQDHRRYDKVPAKMESHIQGIDIEAKDGIESWVTEYASNLHMSYLEERKESIGKSKMRAIKKAKVSKLGCAAAHARLKKKLVARKSELKRYGRIDVFDTKEHISARIITDGYNYDNSFSLEKSVLCSETLELFCDKIVNLVALFSDDEFVKPISGIAYKRQEYYGQSQRTSKTINFEDI